MSTTIGIGYSSTHRDLQSEIQGLAEKFGYGVLIGIDHADQDVRKGIGIAQKHEGWEHILFLQSPLEDHVALAFGIHEELITFETKELYPPFFNFLQEFSSLCCGKCNKLGIFFAGEWYEKDRIRFLAGTVEDLIAVLSMPGSWGIRYLIPETGRFQDSDEIPLLFDLKS